MAVVWENWSGSVRCKPERIMHPASEEEIVALVGECRSRQGTLRVVGGGHSFTPLVKTAGLLLSLDHYRGLVAVDQAAQRATARAGTSIQALGEALFQHSLAQPNMGDIDVQSIAGAVSTGTHGSGITLGSISSQVSGLTLITASGEVLECSAERDPEVFKAAQVSLGALGVITQVQLQLVPAYKLRFTWRKGSLNETLANLDAYLRENRNFEFYWMPYTDTVQSRLMNTTTEPVRAKTLSRRFNETVLENGALWLVSEYARRLPHQAPGVSKLVAALVSGGTDVNHSHHVYATPRLVKFQEMEYSIPLAEFVPTMREIAATISRHRFQVHFPIECRFVRGDDIFLSPAAGRDSAYIAVHMYKGMQHRTYFAAMEQILLGHGGRPHWGKMHNLAADRLAALYPDWERFQAVRRRLDPDGLFLNEYLRAIFAPAAER